MVTGVLARTVLMLFTGRVPANVCRVRAGKSAAPRHTTSRPPFFISSSTEFSYPLNPLLLVYTIAKIFSSLALCRIVIVYRECVEFGDRASTTLQYNRF